MCRRSRVVGSADSEGSDKFLSLFWSGSMPLVFQYLLYHTSSVVSEVLESRLSLRVDAPWGHVAVKHALKFNQILIFQSQPIRSHCLCLDSVRIPLAGVFAL